MGTPIVRIKDENGVWHDIPAIRGLSAYQLAVKNGYEGTEEQWIASIEGVEGKSAYQVAQAEGYEGTVTEWLASLKGDKGDAGAAGPTMTTVTVTLPSSGWETVSSGSYLDTYCAFKQVIEVPGVTPTSNGILSVVEPMTKSKRDALVRARLFIFAQQNGVMIIGGTGTMPTEDISLVVLITPEEESET